MGWNFSEGIAIYQQIMQILRIRIASSEYPPGSKMPAVRDLAMEAGVNPNTMQRALAELEREGLLFSVRTSGRFVTKEQEKLQKLRRQLSRDYIEQMLKKLYALGFSQEEIHHEVSMILRADLPGNQHTKH